MPVAVLFAAVLGMPGTAHAAPPSGPAPATTLVLPTGERVEVTSPADHARVMRHTGSPPVQIIRVGARTLLLPPEALRHLGQLDLDLFDVAQLAAHAARLPVVLTGSARSVPGVTITSRAGSTAHGYITPQSAARFGAAVRSRDGLAGVQRLALDAPAAATPAFPQVTLDIDVASPAGVHPSDTFLLVVNTDDQRKANLAFGLSGTNQRVSVPKGHYSLLAFTVVPTADDLGATIRFGFAPSVTVAGDTHAVVDTRDATRDAYPTFATPRAASVSWADLFYQIGDDRGVVANGVENPGPALEERVLAPAVTGGAHGTLTSVAIAALKGPASGAQYRYYLTRVHRNAVVPDEHVTVAASSLATVQVHEYTDGRRFDNAGGRFPNYPYFDVGEFVIDDLPDTTVRTEYLSTGGGLKWLSDDEQGSSDGSAARDVTGLARAFPAGQTVREDLFRGPLAPGLVSRPGLGNPDCQACRSASNLIVGVPSFTDSEPLHVGQRFSDKELQLTIRRDGTTVFDSEQSAYAFAPAVVPVPSGAHGYDIVAVRDARDVGQRRSSQSRTEWTFRSSATSGAPAPSGWTCPGTGNCTVLPVLTIDDPLPTSAAATLPVGKTQVVVTVAPVEGANTRVAGLSYAVGVDGKAFVAQAVRSLGGGRYLVTIDTPKAPAGTGISVHLHAIDTAGGSIDQTVHSAYAIAGS